MTPSRLFRWRFTSCCGHDAAPAVTVGTTRREFMMLAAGGVAGVATLARRGEAAAQGRVFPPPPPLVSPVEGLIDFHVHCAPDVFGRSIDDDEVVTLARDNSMEGLVLKNHVRSPPIAPGSPGSTSRA